MIVKDDIYNEDLKKTVRALKRAFAQQKEAKTGKPYRSSARYSNEGAWLETAKIVLKLKAVPEDYIAAQFKYAKGTVLPNTLHGSIAQGRYTKLVMSGNAIEKTESPSEDEVLSIIEHTMSLLQHTCHTDNLASDAAIEFVVGHSWLFDAVGVMLLTGGDIVVYNGLFMREARLRLMESPHLRRAAQALGFDPDELIERSGNP